MKTTGSSLSIASRSIEYASAGFDGITTVSPGVAVQYASDESEWCSTPPIAPAHGMRTTIGRVIRPLRAVPHLRDVRDHLLERRIAERVELHLDDGAHAVHRHADRGADDARLGERRVPDAVLAELRLQAVGDAEHAAERADVLAVDDDAVVVGHRVAQRGVQRAGHRELRRGGCRGASCRVVVAVIGRLLRGSGAAACERAGRELGLEAGALLEEGGARTRVDVVEELERVEVGLDRHDVARVRGDRLGGIRDLGAHGLGEGALGDQVLLEALDRVAALPVLDVARLRGSASGRRSSCAPRCGT